MDFFNTVVKLKLASIQPKSATAIIILNPPLWHKSLLVFHICQKSTQTNLTATEFRKTIHYLHSNGDKKTENCKTFIQKQLIIWVAPSFHRHKPRKM